MPGKYPRRSVLKGHANESLALLNLATNTLIGETFDESPDEEVFALSMEAVHTIRDLVVAQGPVVVGVAHGDYSDAEIEAFIENAGSWDRGDLVSQEIARRKIRIIGTFAGEGATEESLNNGMPVKTRLMWNLVTGATLKQWAFNKGSAQLTTGAIYAIEGHVWLKPR